MGCQTRREPVCIERAGRVARAMAAWLFRHGPSRRDERGQYKNQL